MQIRFVNHASFLCEHNGVRLLCDPWLYGSAFNDGWDLVSETRFKTEEFSSIQYIWFSHEHPDHFSPRVLSDIPPELRSRITVLYQQTPERNVLNFCRKLGFATRELIDGERTDLGSGLAVMCRRVPLDDSWLLIETADCRILNLNDTVLERASELGAVLEATGKIDVLFTQFSYAAWRGNREDTAVRLADARKKLGIMLAQIRHLKPKFAVPFASFVYFSHEENGFTNDAVNTPAMAVAAIAGTSARPILLYPDDRWTVGEVHDNSAAEAEYARDYEAARARPPRKSASVPFETLQSRASQYIERIRAANDPRMLFVLRKLPVFPLLGPIEIRLWDLDLTVRFSFENGLEILPGRAAKYDLQMASDSLNFLFKNAFGIDTLTVNGRFFADTAGLKQLLATFGVDALNNSGIRLTPAFLLDSTTIAFLVRIVGRKLWSLKEQGRGQKPEHATVQPTQ